MKESNFKKVKEKAPSEKDFLKQKEIPNKYGIDKLIFSVLLIIFFALILYKPFSLDDTIYNKKPYASNETSTTVKDDTSILEDKEPRSKFNFAVEGIREFIVGSNF